MSQAMAGQKIIEVITVKHPVPGGSLQVAAGLDQFRLGG